MVQVISLQDVVEVNRGAFPGSVAMRMGLVKRLVSLAASLSLSLSLCSVSLSIFCCITLHFSAHLLFLILCIRDTPFFARCVSVVTPTRVLLMECDFEEDADLLFAGLAILSLGKASKKMQDQRKKLKDKRVEADIAKR